MDILISILVGVVVWIWFWGAVYCTTYFITMAFYRAQTKHKRQTTQNFFSSELIEALGKAIRGKK